MGSEFGGTWEHSGGVFFESALKRALKQDQIVHLEGKLQYILYFSREGPVSPLKDVSQSTFLVKKFSVENNYYVCINFTIAEAVIK